MTIRILIADDQELIRTGFRLFLETQPDMHVVGEAADGAKAVAAAQRLRPDVVLMDIRMPRMNGIDATALLAGPDVEDPVTVLLLTTFDTEEYVHGALRAGARGFLLKDAPRERLLDGIRAVAQGYTLLAPSVMRRLTQDVTALDAAPRPLPPEFEQLTPRQRETLGLVARGLTNDEIARSMYVTEATVKSHVGSLLQKLGLRDRVQAVIFAYVHGVVGADGD